MQTTTITITTVLVIKKNYFYFYNNYYYCYYYYYYFKTHHQNTASLPSLLHALTCRRKQKHVSIISHKGTVQVWRQYLFSIAFMFSRYPSNSAPNKCYLEPHLSERVNCFSESALLPPLPLNRFSIFCVFGYIQFFVCFLQLFFVSYYFFAFGFVLIFSGFFFCYIQFLCVC